MNKPNSRKQVDYNRPVGIIDGTIYIVNYTFEDHLGKDPFKGVTGSRLEPVTQEYIDEQNEPDNVKEFVREYWAESAKAGRVDCSLEDFAESWVADMDGEYLGHDPSDVRFVPDDVKKKHFPGAVTFTCIGGGRCFKRGMKWDVILDQHLVDEINRLETEV